MPKKKVATKTSTRTTKTVSSRRSYENGVEQFFVETLPPMPESLKEFIVNFGPWLVLLMLIMMLPAVLAVFGLGAMMAPFGYMMRYSLGYAYSMQWMISLVSFGLSAWALQGLFRRSLSSWKLMLYSVIISGVGVLLDGNLVWLIVGTGLSLYVLYQIKSYYK